MSRPQRRESSGKAETSRIQLLNRSNVKNEIHATHATATA